MNMMIGGIRYHIKVSGNGDRPLVLLHGFTGDSSTWNPFFSNWVKDFNVIAPDIIGHGKTESPEKVDQYQIESVADTLKGILDKLNLEEIDLLGYSMGGRLALTFALMFPGRVRKLILESTSPGIETEKDRELRRIKDAELAKFILEKGVVSFVDYWQGIPLFSTMKQLPRSVTEPIREQRLQNCSQGLANSLLGMGTGSQPSWWGNPIRNLSCEVLIVTGAEDKKYSAIAEKMEKEIKNCTWIQIENSGHTIHVEQPEKFGTIVSEFLLRSNKGGVHFDS